MHQYYFHPPSKSSLCWTLNAWQRACLCLAESMLMLGWLVGWLAFTIFTHGTKYRLFSKEIVYVYFSSFQLQQLVSLSRRSSSSSSYGKNGLFYLLTHTHIQHINTSHQVLLIQIIVSPPPPPPLPPSTWEEKIYYSGRIVTLHDKTKNFPRFCHHHHQHRVPFMAFNVTPIFVLSLSVLINSRRRRKLVDSAVGFFSVHFSHYNL